MEHIVNGASIAWQGNRGTADASDLGFDPGYFPVTFSVRSPRTDRVVTFRRAVDSSWQPRCFRGDAFCYTSEGLAAPVAIAVFAD